MTGDERFAAIRMNATMFASGLLIMALVAAAGALVEESAEAGVPDAIVVQARVADPSTNEPDGPGPRSTTDGPGRPGDRRTLGGGS